ncbi:MAG: prolipoprotein diacylglyceryl transferase [Gammaproteobacteria bacterium]|nr:prolipoprotein diacylglyceryl transferase [Gammaproteobacteria bacterium]MCP5138117.1 prolipoprotein diacylglyceryl transferase [Gammaproteobacteria bacterium]
MLTYPGFDPIALQLGPLAIRWYGLMYAVGFLGFWWVGRRRARLAGSGWAEQDLDDLLWFGALGVILGGRIGYMLFYDTAAIIHDPTRILHIWNGGMSFHGGLLGVLVAMAWYGHRRGKRFFEVMDFVAVLTPIGLAAGRIGNFINGELWGGPGSVPWAMRVSCEDFGHLCANKLGLPPGTEWTPALHPSQLYEALLEGPVLFALLWWFASRNPPTRAVSGLFLLGYGVFRFSVELVRIPDAHIGYLAFGWVTMGQVLSLPMVLGGVFLIWLAYRKA